MSCRLGCYQAEWQGGSKARSRLSLQPYIILRSGSQSPNPPAVAVSPQRSVESTRNGHRQSRGGECEKATWRLLKGGIPKCKELRKGETSSCQLVVPIAKQSLPGAAGCLAGPSLGWASPSSPVLLLCTPILWCVPIPHYSVVLPCHSNYPS